MRFLDAEFVQGFIRMANDGWEQGWHERNGGNISYRVKDEEVESVKEELEPKEWRPNYSSSSGRRVFPCNRQRKVSQKCNY